MAGRQQKGGRRWWSGGPKAAPLLHGGGAISRPLGAPPSFPPVFGATAGSEPPRRQEGGEREGGNGGRGRGGTIRGGNERRPADLQALNQIARAKPPQRDGEARAPSRAQPAAPWASGRPARIHSGGEERAGASPPSTCQRSRARSKMWQDRVCHTPARFSKIYSDSPESSRIKRACLTLALAEHTSFQASI